MLTTSIQHESTELIGKLICMTYKQSLSSYRIGPNGNRKRAGLINNISVSIGLQNVMDRYGTDQKAIRYNGNIVID